jgi:hypothetical protein
MPEETMRAFVLRCHAPNGDNARSSFEATESGR